MTGRTSSGLIQFDQNLKFVNSGIGKPFFFLKESQSTGLKRSLHALDIQLVP